MSKKQKRASAPKKGGRRWALAAVCYALGVALWLGCAAGGYMAQRARLAGGELTQRELGTQDVVLESMKLLEAQDGAVRVVSTDADPHIVYRPGGAFVAGRVVFAAQPHKPGGEMVLYYTTRPDAEFEEQNKLWARQSADGSWHFDVGGRQVYALRLDTDTEGGVIWEVERFAVGLARPAASFFVPDVMQWALLLLAPGFAAALCNACAALWRQGRREIKNS